MKRKDIAFIVFVIGIAIAISGGAQVPNKELGNRWPDSLPIFFTGFVIALAGLMWWRSCAASFAADLASAKSGKSDFLEHLARALKDVTSLEERLDSMQTDAIKDVIDEILLDRIHPFVEDRQLLIDRMGMRDAAEIILKAASVERKLNRVWSASGDNHRPETVKSLIDARQDLARLVESLPSSPT